MNRYKHRPTDTMAMRLKQVIEFPEPLPRTRRGEPGDWAIVNGRGELYFIPDDEFRKLYEPADIAAETEYNRLHSDNGG